MCFTAAFGTPAACWHSYLLHLEDLIVLLLGNRSLDSSFEDTEAAWAPAQPPGLPSLAAIPTHPLQLSLPSLHSHRCCCFTNCQAHRHSKTLPQNNGATTKSLLMVPNASSKPHGQQHPSGSPPAGPETKASKRDRLSVIRSNRNEIPECVLKQQPQQEHSFDAEAYQPKE